MNRMILFFEAACLVAGICSCQRKPAAPSGAREDAPSLFSGVSPTDTLVSWYDKYPRDVRLVGRWLCVLMAKSDTCMYLYDKTTGDFGHRLGVLGEGPEDMMAPEFVHNSDKEAGQCLRFCDVNAHRSFSLTPDARLADFSPFHSGLSSVNLVAGAVIGHPLEGEPSLWAIRYADGRELRVGLQPSVPSSLTEKVHSNLRYIYSCHVLSDSGMRSIVVPMYFFDLIQVYDGQGNLCRYVSPQDGYRFEDSLQALLRGDDYWGYPQCFSTERYCYLYRCLTDGRTRRVKRAQLMKLDWEGHIQRSVELDRPLSGGFCVENDTTAYCIVGDVRDDEEVYRLVRYAL